MRGSSVVAIPDSARALLQAPIDAHCVTLNPDGSPQMTLVWVIDDGDDVLFSTGLTRRKTRNLLRDPRVALSLAGPDTNEAGLHHSLLIHGTASIEHGQTAAADLMDQLAQLYLGVPTLPFADLRAPDAHPQIIIRVTITRLFGIGPWMEGPQTSFGTPAQIPEQR